MGIVKKKVSQTEQQTYKGESRKAYFRYFSPSVVSEGLFLEKDQTKYFPRSIVSRETWRFISSLVLGAIKAPERKDSILRDALKAECVNNIKAPVWLDNIALLWDKQCICQ